MSSVSSLNSLLSSSSSSSSSVDISSLLAAATGATSVGIDVTSAVDAAIYAAQAPERQWQAQQTTLQSQMTALTSVQSALTTLSSDLGVLNSPNGALSATAVSSTDPSLVTGTASPGTAVGTHVLTISHLATSASWYSSPLSSASSTLGSSTFTVTQNSGSTNTFSLGSNGLTSLSSLANAINGDALGITASVVTDANGTRLALVSNTSGSGGNFTVSDGGTSGAGWTSASVAGASSSLAASTFQVSDGTSAATINVAAGSTLADVANQINSQGLDLNASVITDASGAHLAVAAGGGGSVSLSSDPAFVLTQPSQGANASLTVDGIPISSASNTVTGAVSGLTLNLQGVTSGSQQVTLDVTPDTTQISAAISQFVTNYNSAVSLVNTQFTYNSSSQSEGVLGSDGTVRSLQSTLLGVGAYSTTGDSSSSPVSTLASMGISMNDDGTLSINSTQLNQTITNDPSGVLNFFQGSALNGFASSLSKQITGFNEPSVGALSIDMNSLNQQYTDLQTDVNNYESGYIASQRTVLTNMYSKAEIALQQLPTTLKQLQAQLGNNSGS